MMDDKKDGIISLILVITLFAFVVWATNVYTQIGLIPLIFVYIIIFYGIIINIKKISNRKYLGYFLILLFVKLIFLCYQSVKKEVPLGATDWKVFDILAKSLLSQADSIFSIIISSGSKEDALFSKIVAMLYYIFGRTPELISFYVFATSFITQLFLYKTVFFLTNNKNTAQKIALMWMIWPIEFLFSASFLREMPIQCLFIVSFYYFLQFLKQEHFPSLIKSVISILTATLMHSGMVAVLFAYLFIWAIRNNRYVLFKVVLGFVSLLVLLTSPVGKQMTQKMGEINEIELAVIVENMPKSTRGNTNYVDKAPTNTAELLIQLPYRLFMFAFSPLPWQIINLSTLFAWLIDGIFQLLFAFLLFRLLFKFNSTTQFASNLKKTIFTVIISTYIVFSLGTNTSGTAMRHRSKIIPMVILLIPLTSATRNLNSLYIKRNKKQK
jgi:hypothetical protein